MRIAIVTTSYPASPADPAGHFVRAEALNLASLGHDVHVVAPCGDAGGLCADAGVSVWPISHGGVFGWPGAATRLRAHPWRAPGALVFATLAERALVKLQPEHLHAHWLVPCAYPIGSALDRDIPIEATAHGADVRLLIGLPPALRHAVVRRLLDHVAIFRFVAESLASCLLDALPRELAARLEQRIKVRPALLRLPDVSERARALRRAHRTEVLAATVGRLVASKRFELAVSAANVLGDHVRLLVVGDGPERGNLAELDRRGNVVFEGRMDWDQALVRIAASDVLVHPSAVEAAPTVVREARALGTPVVACESGDVMAWARHDPGIRIVRPDSFEIAAAVARLRAEAGA